MIIAAHDGIVTRYTGVGTILQNTIRTVLDRCSELPEGTRVHLACPTLAGDRSAEDLVCEGHSRDLVARTGGWLIELDNGTARDSRNALWGHGSPQHWRTMTASLATRLTELTAVDPGPVAVMAHDTPFLHLQLEPWTANSHARRSLFLPHSTGANHGPFAEDGPDPERLAYERACFTAIDRDPRSTLCATGRWVGAHLEEAYGVRPEPTAEVPNGLYLPAYRDALDRRTTLEDLRQHVPRLSDTSRILFSWGRASRVKGFVPLVRGWDQIAARHPDHVLVLQVPDESGEPDYAAELAAHARRSERCVVLDDFDPTIWQSFLRSSSTDVVVIPSLADPNPHTPLEAQLFSTGNYAIVASRIDGIVESFSGQNALLVDEPSSASRWATALERAIATSPAWRRTAAEESATALERFDYSATLDRLFDRHVLPALTDAA